MAIGTFIRPQKIDISDIYAEARLNFGRQGEQVRRFLTHHHPQTICEIKAPRGEIRTLSAGEGVIKTDKRTTKIIVASVIGLVCAVSLLTILNLQETNTSQKQKTHPPEASHFSILYRQKLLEKRGYSPESALRQAVLDILRGVDINA